MRQQTRQLKKPVAKSPSKKAATSKIRATRTVRTALQTKLAAARRITEELFPGEIRIERDYDPEYPAHRFIVFNVRATGETKELLDRQCEWHRRLAAIVPNDGESITISIYPTE